LNSPPKIIVTRPVGQAQAWLDALQAQGHSAVHVPLIEIAPVGSAADQAARHCALEGIQANRALMFVSSNAVEHFFKPNTPLAHIKRAQSAMNSVAFHAAAVRYWATGPGTVKALLAAGVAAQQIDAPAHDAGQFDSEALWHKVHDQLESGDRILIVRGRDAGTLDSSRDWLAQRVEECGARADTLVVYERRAPALEMAQLEQCQSWLTDGSVWLFSSSQAVRHLPATLDASKGICISTHPRIAQAATARGFAVVCTSRPTIQDLLASIKSMHE
jgi:uroporphyrinogen-III synthase